MPRCLWATFCPAFGETRNFLQIFTVFVLDLPLNTDAASRTSSRAVMTIGNKDAIAVNFGKYRTDIEPLSDVYKPGGRPDVYS